MPSRPASILISYALVGFIVYLVMCGLGEMAAWLPLGSGFAGYATRFVDPALGFALGYVSSSGFRHSMRNRKKQNESAE